MRLSLSLSLALAAAGAALAQDALLQRWTNYGAGISAGGELAVTWSSATTTDRLGYRLFPFDGEYTFAPAPELASYAAPPGKSLPAYTSQLIHRNYLTGLPKGMRLQYVIATDPADPATFSGVSEVLTHPGVGPDVPATLMVLADIDRRPSVVAALSDPAHNRTARATAGGVVLGDLSYANGDNAVWDSWQEFFDPVAAKLPIMVNAGNHELTNEPGFVAFKTRFGAMPYTREFEDAVNLFYSFEVGAMHVIVLSAFSDYSAASTQTFFLKSDLAKVNRTRTPWLLVGFHAPWYNANTQHFLQVDDMRVEYEPLFLAARVNVVMVGHVHAFQRTKMIGASGLVVDDASGKGIVHWMVGMTGKSLYKSWRPEPYPEPQPPDAPQNDWVAAKDATFFGFSTIEVPNATHACLRAFCTERSPANAPGACDPDVPLDEYWLVNQLVANPLPTPAPPPSATSLPSATASESVTPTISQSPTASLSFGASPSNTPSASPTLSVSPSPTSSAGAAAGNALAAERSAEGAMTSKALGTGVGVGLVVAAVVAAGASFLSSLRRRLVREKLAAKSAPAVVVTEFGVRV